MSLLGEVIIRLTSPNNPITFSHWVTLLNFFTKHQEQLDFDDIKIIVDKSEEYRLYLNEHSCSFIERNDVHPNVYKHLELLDK